jgi:hypothetical protein
MAFMELTFVFLFKLKLVFFYFFFSIFNFIYFNAICCILNFFFFCLSSFPFLNFDLGQDIVNAICDDDDIKAISFVGPNAVSYSLVLKH